ncbi:gustatory and pheromone receptor 39a [Calliphora vicina]|uniref:gustatory and pheromone receptor 39a n=1 Tax=Calliphora vicina TaxID=7373 RepID=UPI00325B7018
MNVAREDVSCTYGIAIMVCTIAVAMESISNVYLLAITEMGYNSTLFAIQSLSWSMPILIYLIVGLLCNKVGVEVSREEISYIYGIAILICTMFIMLESVADFYIAAISGYGTHVLGSKGHLTSLHSMLWILPMLIYLITGFLINNTSKELQASYLSSLNDIEFQKFRNLLLFYDEIMCISSKEISSIYGIPMLICTIVISLEAISNIFIIAIFEFGNNQFTFINSELKNGALISYLIMLPMSFTICGIIVMMHICVTKILGTCLKLINNEMCKIMQTNRLRESKKRLHDLIMKRNNILNICQYELSYKFGLVLLPIVAYAMFYIPSGPFFLISVVFETKFANVAVMIIPYIITLLWDVPMLVIFVMTMTSNNIQNEANKTAQILARIPRTKTSLDQMIDKFLWKNLRPKPILTAYGFFSLDRSTLFKLFTAIFTYMVILVQFKEMENTTKLLNNQT